MERIIRQIGDTFTIKNGELLVVKKETNQCEGCFFYTMDHFDRCKDRFYEAGACHKGGRPDGIGIIVVLKEE